MSSENRRVSAVNVMLMTSHSIRVAMEPLPTTPSPHRCALRPLFPNCLRAIRGLDTVPMSIIMPSQQQRPSKLCGRMAHLRRLPLQPPAATPPPPRPSVPALEDDTLGAWNSSI